ncbi:kinase-like protein [Aaosphaeria arxii CBS 175.79]|uniref:Kinase-like protein n=1 Tax=Aaosphaeria arxii CBS 175.79 TaxID=1450172 RepID=A0A6A5XU84_9PLEO|nr:kinase-like protein [Aaosphaeria arxii CBS 175.79]KAF2016271.1 kinase-like protein [Aaosphaeria arxii CBS 175.79]
MTACKRDKGFIRHPSYYKTTPLGVIDYVACIRPDLYLSWICVYVIVEQVNNESKTNDPVVYVMQSLWRFLGQSPYLEITEGSDLELDDIDVKSLPYQHIENLGSGGSAIVERVQDMNTGLVYARKTLRDISYRDRKRLREQFHNEVKVMRRLGDHPHTTTLFATYTTRRDLVLIVSPVADGGNLADFLAHHRDWGNAASQLHHVAVLNRAFGCLASGLAFMHGQGVRHKDIKPQNILVHDGHVLYTDFGISREFLEAQSTTGDNPGSFTRRYCAPEVADWGDRNRSADIFSLGCVFLEVLVALFPRIAPAGILDGAYHITVHEGRLPGQIEYSKATSRVDSTFRHLIADHQYHMASSRMALVLEICPGT